MPLFYTEIYTFWQFNLLFWSCFYIQVINNQFIIIYLRVDYLELSQSHLYKLTSSGSIPHYKPNGKKLYFKREELDTWLLRNRNNSIDEIEQEAANYLIKKGRVQL